MVFGGFGGGWLDFDKWFILSWLGVGLWFSGRWTFVFCVGFLRGGGKWGFKVLAISGLDGVG